MDSLGGVRDRGADVCGSEVSGAGCGSERSSEANDDGEGCRPGLGGRDGKAGRSERQARPDRYEWAARHCGERAGGVNSAVRVRSRKEPDCGAAGLGEDGDMERGWGAQRGGQAGPGTVQGLDAEAAGGTVWSAAAS